MSAHFATVGPISVHFPEMVETNADLQAAHPNWDMRLIESKTGIERRYLAASDETPSDLGVAAARKLFDEHAILPSTIDFLLYCTQTPDYPLPTTACLMQERLGLPTSCGALDFNLGCSGFVYGLSLAEGLIRSGAARRILFITAETYSKYIHADDRSLRTIFGDAGAATLIEAGPQPTLSAFRFGTDGTGADTLMVAEGGRRQGDQALKPRHRHRWPSALYMDGPSLINFTVANIPILVEQILEGASLEKGDVHRFLFHQATFKMLDLLREEMEIEPDRLPIDMADGGNTVSCTLPILIERLRRRGQLPAQSLNMLIGFGVGWSWAGCVWRETWQDG